MRCSRARTSSTRLAPKWWTRMRWRARFRNKGIRAGLDVFAGEPPGGTGEFVGRDLRNEVYGTHHIGASTEQAQEAIAAETVRIIRTFKETGKVPNVVNLAKSTPATLHADRAASGPAGRARQRARCDQRGAASTCRRWRTSCSKVRKPRWRASIWKARRRRVCWGRFRRQIPTFWSWGSFGYNEPGRLTASSARGSRQLQSICKGR